MRAEETKDVKSALDSLTEELEADRSLGERQRFRERAEALERLDAYSLDAQLLSLGEESSEAEVFRRARALRAKLEAANSEFCETIREEIVRGGGAKALLPWVHQPSGAADAVRVVPGESYDYSDELVSGVLRFAKPDSSIGALPAEMVAYQPTPARHIFDLIDRAEITERDVLVDLGSGLGHVSLLASICTGVRSIGIEVEAAYVNCARESAEALKLRNVTFIQQDAREANLSIGTVFYLYTPFRGTILRVVLDLLSREAARRTVRVCTFGPCTAAVAEEQWMEAKGEIEAGRIAVFRSR
jgi:hypothetical protein